MDMHIYRHPQRNELRHGIILPNIVLPTELNVSARDMYVGVACGSHHFGAPLPSLIHPHHKINLIDESASTAVLTTPLSP